jgi:hypothetical protein
VLPLSRRHRAHASGNKDHVKPSLSIHAVEQREAPDSRYLRHRSKRLGVPVRGHESFFDVVEVGVGNGKMKN